MTLKKKKNWMIWTLWLFLGLGVIAFLLHLFSFSGFSHRWVTKRFEFNKNQTELLLQQSKSQVQEYLKRIKPSNAVSFRGLTLPDNVSVYIFHDDSLVFWNANQLEPRRLRKKVPLDCDTLMDFHSTSYLVSSASTKNYSFYLFSSLGDLQAQETILFTKPIWCYSSIIVVFLCAFLLAFRRFYVKRREIHAVKPALPILLLLFTFLAFILGFRRLFSYGFQHQFFIPSYISIDLNFFIYCVAFLFFILMLLGIKSLFQRSLSESHRIWLPVSIYVALLLIAAFLFDFHWITLLFGLVVLVFFVVASRSHFFGDALFMVFQILLWSLLLTHLYDQEYTRFENNNIQELAAELADERDPDFESSYRQFLNVAQHDTTFFSTVLSDDIMEEVAEDYMRNFLFDSVMNQYTVKLTLCQPGVELEVQPQGVVSDCMGYFQEKVEKNHGVDLGEGLCFIDYNTLDPNYLSMINILVRDTVTDRNLFLEFSKPVAPQGFGLSRLLKETTGGMVPVNSSVACYQDSLLVYKYGSYVYPNYLSDYQHRTNGFSNGRLMKHYAYQAEGNKVIAISVNRRGWMDSTVPFAFFFFYLLVLFMLVYFVGGMGRKQSFTGTLSSKFQMIVLVALGITFLLVGPVSVVYMRGIYNQKANNFHFERTRSLQQDLTSEVDFSFLRKPGFHYELDRILWHYSATFFTDINIYGLDGKLLATTCPELQEMHLQASLMNAEAFHNMQGERSLYFIHDEHLKNATYQSAYIAIQDGTGKTLAYLNTPYFSSKSGLRVEIVNFVLTYINIMLLIILFFLPLVLLLTRSVTNPLVQLQKKMQQIDINSSNELLEWESKDEIGALVRQYNQLVVELEKSAAELRRTTAESAWRGVARQVAHEIKNSLTPMRLSVQLLQRSMENGATDLEERVKRTSATLIEQIDALSNIASSFSSYAKLPESHPQPLDLADLVGNVVNLYDNAENIEFSYQYDPSQSYAFNGDKTHLNSAVGNIIKNATQAIGNKPDGKIEVRLQTTESFYVISVKDNGKGIKEENKKLIFLPNFTTKSGGSGVGLSLTYNIIQAAGGTITFDSTEGEGTQFVITLPK